MVEKRVYSVATGIYYRIPLALASCVYSGHTSDYQKTWNLNCFLLLEL